MTCDMSIPSSMFWRNRSDEQFKSVISVRGHCSRRGPE
jgi:hypothetical protein